MSDGKIEGRARQGSEELIRQLQLFDEILIEFFKSEIENINSSLSNENICILIET